MSGSGMIAAIPEGLAVQVSVEFEDQPSGCILATLRAKPPSVGDLLEVAMDYAAHTIALGIICHAAAKCTEAQSLADCGRIDRDGADLFVRRYSESIADIVGLIIEKGN